MTEDSINQDTVGTKLNNLITELRALSPGKMLPFKVIVNSNTSTDFMAFIDKLIQDKCQNPGLDFSYYEFYNTQIKGISRYF